jgi:hypothetical protein
VDHSRFVERVPAKLLPHIAAPAVAMSRLRLGSDGNGESGGVHDGGDGDVLSVPSKLVVEIARCKIAVSNHLLERPNLWAGKDC